MLKLCIATLLVMAATTAAMNVNHVYHKKGEAPKYTFEDGPYGGNGGSAWSDGTSVYLNGEITKIDIWSGARVDGIRAQYGTTWSANHGGSGGSLHNIDLKFGETIISVTGRAGTKVDQLQFVTNLGIYGPFGGGGGSAFSSTHYDCRVIYFSGSGGQELDSIAFHYECPDKEE